MKRSEINAIQKRAEAFLASQCFTLPPFSRWSLEQWQRPAAIALLQAGLGWAITDFGFGDFAQQGATVFTLRNAALVGSVYSEKIIVLESGQYIGHHYHEEKTEDVINRAGGSLEIQLHSLTNNNQLGTTPVRLARDGLWQEIPSGSFVQLQAGESITLLPRVSHSFRATDTIVLMGEISSVNNDATDNYFVNGTNPEVIEEDTAPYRLLTRDDPLHLVSS